jgi:hypothetical protein
MKRDLEVLILRTELQLERAMRSLEQLKEYLEEELK